MIGSSLSGNTSTPTAKTMYLSHLSLIVICLTTTCLVVPPADVAIASDGAVRQVAVEAPSTKHQLWLVSTRLASSCPSLDQTSRLQCWRFDADCRWRCSSLGQLLSTDDPEEMTLIYVHENRVSEAESFRRAGIVFQHLTKVVPAAQRIRLIAISWPSDRIGIRQRPDVQIKAERSEAHGFYLAWLLDQIDPDVPVSLFGMSYGPRLIAASLHCLAGGSIQGQRLTQRVHRVRRPVRTVFMAAAFDANWLAPGQHYGLALTQVEQMLVAVNHADPALHFYPHLYRLLVKGPEALGYVGVRGSLTSEDAAKIIEWNVRCIVGPTHNWRVYDGSLPFMEQIAPYLLGE